MIVPNFATKPFLNTRPVWLTTAAAVILSVAFGFANAQLYVESNQALAAQLSLRDMLQEQHSLVEGEVKAQLDELGRIPWRSFIDRVESLNVVLDEHDFSWLDMLDHLESTLPYGVRAVSIEPEVERDGVYLGIVAVARTREAFLEFLDRLIADPHFAEPMPDRETWPESGEHVGYQFDLIVKYEPPADGAS